MERAGDRRSPRWSASARWGSTSSAISRRRTRSGEVFRRQIDIARRVRKPLVIHCRDAHDETLAILAEERAREIGGVMHCFSGDVEIARRCLDLGLLHLAGGAR